MSATVYCRDVAAVYRHFQYPLDHLTGLLTLEKKVLTVDLQTLKGGQPVHLKGTIENPGVDAVVQLDIQAESIPIDDALKSAMPPDVRKVVDQFNPSGVVKAHATVLRKPLPGQPDRPEGTDRDQCRDRFVRAVRDHLGRVAIPDPQPEGPTGDAPGSLGLQEHAGTQRQGDDRGQRKCRKACLGPSRRNGEDPLKIDVKLEAQNLPFQRRAEGSAAGSLEKKLADDQPIGQLATSKPRSTSRRANPITRISRSCHGPSRMCAWR